MSKTVWGVILVFAALAALAVSVAFGPKISAFFVAATMRLRAMGPFGWLIFVGVEFAVTLVGFVPGVLLGLAAGAIYGVTAGFLASAVGILAGAVVAFALSRSMLRPWIGLMLGRHQRLSRLDGMIAKDGWRIVALLRISPVMPFSITSYALGFSGISMRDYFLGTLASMPPLLGYVVLGALGGMGMKATTQSGSDVHMLLLGLGAAATLALTIHLSRMLGQALRSFEPL